MLWGLTPQAGGMSRGDFQKRESHVLQIKAAATRVTVNVRTEPDPGLRRAL